MGSIVLFGVLPYTAVGIFILGILTTFYLWIRTPVPLRIVATPAPRTRTGVAWRLFGDLLWFPNLFKADKPLWIAGWSFHILLWLALLRHLRYFLYPLPGWVSAIQTLGLYAGYFIPIPLAFLLGRRLIHGRTLYVSILGDYFALFLLLSVTISGLLLQLFFRTYLVDIKALIIGLIHFQIRVPDAHWLFILHFLLVMLLLVYFPFSKLMHGPGLLLNPTRNQRARFEQRLVNPWDSPVFYNPLNLSSPEKYREELQRPKEGEGE